MCLKCGFESIHSWHSIRVEQLHLLRRWCWALLDLPRYVPPHSSHSIMDVDCVIMCRSRANVSQLLFLLFPPFNSSSFCFLFSQQCTAEPFSEIITVPVMDCRNPSITTIRCYHTRHARDAWRIGLPPGHISIVHGCGAYPQVINSVIILTSIDMVNYFIFRTVHNHSVQEYPFRLSIHLYICLRVSWRCCVPYMLV